MNVTNLYSPSQGLIVASSSGFQQYTDKLDSYSSVLTGLYVSSFDKNNKYCIDSCWESGNIYYANYDEGYVKKISYDGTTIATLALVNPSMVAVVQNAVSMNTIVTYPPQDDQGCWIADKGAGKIIRTDKDLNIVVELSGITTPVAIKSDIDGGCYVVNGTSLIKISSDAQIINSKTFASFSPAAVKFVDIAIDAQGWIWFCADDNIFNLSYTGGRFNQQFVLKPLSTDDPFSSSSSSDVADLIGEYEAHHIGAIDVDRNNVSRHLYVSGGNSYESFILKYNYSGVLLAQKQYSDIAFPYVIKVIQGMGSDSLYILEDSSKWDDYGYGSSSSSTSSSSSYIENWSSSSSSKSSNSSSTSSSSSYIKNWSSSSSSKSSNSSSSKSSNSSSSSSSYIENWSSSSGSSEG